MASWMAYKDNIIVNYLYQKDIAAKSKLSDSERPQNNKSNKHSGYHGPAAGGKSTIMRGLVEFDVD